MKPLIGITAVRGEETGYYEATGRLFDYSMQSYQAVIRRFGAIPVLIPAMAEATGDKEYADRLLSKLDGLYFSGGGLRIGGKAALPTLYEQQPLRSAWEDFLMKEAYERDIPTIGVCRGYQMMAVALGGSMDTVRIPEHKQEAPYGRGCHTVYLKADSKLAAAVGPEPWFTNSIHVERLKEIPENFIVSAQTEDGSCEAIEATNRKFFLGTQFHPELMPDDPRSARYFSFFLSACSEK